MAKGGKSPLRLIKSPGAWAGRPSAPVAPNGGTVYGAMNLQLNAEKTDVDETGGAGKLGAKDVGLVGTIQVTFKEGNATKSTMAIAGQPLASGRQPTS